MAESNFWSNYKVDPKRQFRWLLYVGSISDVVPAWVIQTVSKPKFEVGMSEIAFLNHTFKYPGRVKWGEMQMTLLDPVSPDTSQAFLDILSNSGYIFPDTFEDATSMSVSKARAVEALGGQLRIVQLGPPRVPNAIMHPDVHVEEWRIVNPWVADTDFGKLDYKSEDPVEISVTIQYDWAVKV